MIKTLIKSTRLSWASKNANMYLLALTYAYFAAKPINNPFEIIMGLIMVTLLWGALYTLNDLTDLDVDRRDHLKQNRAFIENHVDKKFILFFVAILVSIVFIISFTIFPPAFTLILSLMFLNQLFYTLPPIRLKETKFAPFFSTATNSVLRLASCAVLLGGVFMVPFSVYLFMYLAGMGTYLMYKSKTTYASLVGVMAGVVLLYTLLVGDMNFIQFAVAILPSALAAIPLYLSLFTKKDDMFHIADILYHQVAMVFFLICIIVIIF